MITKPIIFQINFDGIVLSSRLEQSYKRFKLCAKFHHLRFADKGIIKGGTLVPRLTCSPKTPVLIELTLKSKRFWWRLVSDNYF